MSGGAPALKRYGCICCDTIMPDTCDCLNIDPTRFIGLKAILSDFTSGLMPPNGSGNDPFEDHLFYRDRSYFDARPTAYSKTLQVLGYTDIGTGHYCQYKLDMTIKYLIDRGTYHYRYGPPTKLPGGMPDYDYLECRYHSAPPSIWIHSGGEAGHPIYGDWCDLGHIAGSRLDTFVVEATREAMPQSFAYGEMNITTPWLRPNGTITLVFANARYSAGCYAEITACSCNSARIEP